MRTFFGEATAMQNKEFIACDDRGKIVRDEYHGSAVAQPPEHRIDCGFG